jgi:hypothetical protein
MWPDIYDMSDEEFDRWFQSLPAQEQQAVVTELQASQGTTGAFAQATPEVSPASWDISTMFMPNPDVDAKGRVEPWDLSNQAQGWNYVQDQMQSAMAPSSLIFGGMGSYDPSLFEPTTVFNGPTIDTRTPGLDRAQALASGQGTGWTKELALDIANGVDPSVAVGNLVKLIQDATENPDLADDPETQAILATLPKNYQGLSLEQQSLPEAEKALAAYDLDALQSYALDLSNEIASDPRTATGYEDPRTGVIYQNAPTTEYSKIAQSFIDAGLPFPTERYDDPARLDAIAPIDTQRFETAKAAKERGVNGRQTEADRAITNADEMAREWEAFQRQSSDYRRRLAEPLPAAKGPKPISDAPYAPAEALIPTSPLYRSGVSNVPLDDGVAGLPTMAGAKRSTAPATKRFGPQDSVPRRPTAFMQNGQWTFGTAEEATNSPLARSATNWSPMLPKPADAGVVEQARKQADWKQYLADRERNKVGVQIGNKHGYYQAPGMVERLGAMSRAQTMTNQGRTPLTDAYMQRLMGMRGFGMR